MRLQVQHFHSVLHQYIVGFHFSLSHKGACFITPWTLHIIQEGFTHFVTLNIHDMLCVDNASLITSAWIKVHLTSNLAAIL